VPTAPFIVENWCHPSRSTHSWHHTKPSEPFFGCTSCSIRIRVSRDCPLSYPSVPNARRSSARKLRAVSSCSTSACCSVSEELRETLTAVSRSASSFSEIVAQAATRSSPLALSNTSSSARSTMAWSTPLSAAQLSSRFSNASDFGCWTYKLPKLLQLLPIWKLHKQSARSYYKSNFLTCKGR